MRTNRGLFRSIALSLSLVFLGPTQARDREVAGLATITDGDTVVIGDTRIRLHGIDAPETDQICLDKNGREWKCGIEARAALARRAGAAQWHCHLQGIDRYKRALAVCLVEGVDINRWMVNSGWALAFTRYSQDYVAEERAAKAAKKGLWSGALIAPWHWRRKDCGTEVLSTRPISIEGHRRLCGAPEPRQASACAIKGNIKRSECIYHVPGGHYYSKISMGGPNKRWFCSEAEAIDAGCRRSKR